MSSVKSAPSAFTMPSAASLSDQIADTYDWEGRESGESERRIFTKRKTASITDILSTKGVSLRALRKAVCEADALTDKASKEERKQRLTEAETAADDMSFLKETLGGKTGKVTAETFKIFNDKQIRRLCDLVDFSRVNLGVGTTVAQSTEAIRNRVCTVEEEMPHVLARMKLRAGDRRTFKESVEANMAVLAKRITEQSNAQPQDDDIDWVIIPKAVQ